MKQRNKHKEEQNTNRRAENVDNQLEVILTTSSNK
jgi:hypothetical protein